MKEKPILFSGPMVQAILEGRKTTTRRIVKPQPPEGTTSIGTLVPQWEFQALDGDPKDADSWGCLGDWFKCPYGQPGDRLWVRETFGFVYITPPGDDTTEFIHYRADQKPDLDIKWTPSIFMPRDYSRITLEIVSVRVERLQEITPYECEKEGILLTVKGAWQTIRDFQTRWDYINKKDTWESNPWVWVIEFKRLEAK